MNTGAGRLELAAVAAVVASVLAGCYPATFRGPGDAALDVASDAAVDTGLDAALDANDAVAPVDAPSDAPSADVVPTGVCVPPTSCLGTVCPAGRCSTTTPFACDPFGDGIDPPSTTFSRGTLVTTRGLSLSRNADARLLVEDSSVLTPGHEALLYVVSGPGSGTFASVVVHCIASTTEIFVVAPVTFNVAASAQMQLVPVLHFATLGTPTGMVMVTGSTDPANPSLGGVVALRVQNEASAIIRAFGYPGGTPPTTPGAGGNGTAAGNGSTQATAGQGGAWCSTGGTCTSGGNGGGGANVSAGVAASMVTGCPLPGAAGGAASMMAGTFVAAFGTGGGSGALTTGTAPGAGGAGGGAVFLAARTFFGSIDVSGAPGTAGGTTSSGGGGGGGGTIVYVQSTVLMGGAVLFNALGGSGSTGNCEGTGGNGGAGVIRVYCNYYGAAACGGPVVENAQPPSTAHSFATSPF